MAPFHRRACGTYKTTSPAGAGRRAGRTDEYVGRAPPAIRAGRTWESDSRCRTGTLEGPCQGRKRAPPAYRRPRASFPGNAWCLSSVVESSAVARASPPADRRRPTLFWRVFGTNAVVITAIFLGLALTPATVDSPFPLHLEGFLSVAGLVVFLGVNFLLMRQAFAPLDRLTRFMGRVDPLRPGQRIPAYGHAREVEELTRAFNDMLDRLENERRESGRRELAAQEGERRRLARELHDEIGQRLTGLLLQLEYVLGGAPPETRERLLTMREAAREVLEEVGGVARRLRPPALDDLGLASALAGLTERLSEQAPFPIVRSLAGDLPPLSAESELVLYRIAQESLTNALRHADASRADISLSGTPTGVVLTVTDDGRGLNGAEEGPGIAGMRERAILIGGDFEVVEPPAGGVEVRLEVAREGLEQ